MPYPYVKARDDSVMCAHRMREFGVEPERSASEEKRCLEEVSVSSCYVPSFSPLLQARLDPSNEKRDKDDASTRGSSAEHGRSSELAICGVLSVLQPSADGHAITRTQEYKPKRKHPTCLPEDKNLQGVEAMKAPRADGEVTQEWEGHTMIEMTINKRHENIAMDAIWPRHEGPPMISIVCAGISEEDTRRESKVRASALIFGVIVGRLVGSKYNAT
ncbi:hypothetical protein H4582DRAFT_2051347 [Lactarius indigo]|nr:hypothetical protein H4582DRAFT_2051347 [Lactarius indigo]